MVHLDPNIVVALLRGDQRVATRLKNYLPDVAICTPVLAELLYGAQSSARATENLTELKQLLQVVQLIDFDQASAQVYSKARLALEKKGRPTSEMDLLIASVALASQAVLITHNVKHFEHIPDLRIEDWLI